MYWNLEVKLIVDILRIYDLSVGGFIRKLTTGFILNWSATSWSFSLLFMQYDTYGMMQILAAEIRLFMRRIFAYS